LLLLGLSYPKAKNERTEVEGLRRDSSDMPVLSSWQAFIRSGNADILHN
jgi:hypothetical protein